MDRELYEETIDWLKIDDGQCLHAFNIVERMLLASASEYEGYAAKKLRNVAAAVRDLSTEITFDLRDWDDLKAQEREEEAWESDDGWN